MQESSGIMKYGKAALLVGIALLVPCQLCWADNASLNSAASHAPHAVQPENTADVSLNSSMGLNTGSSERIGASAAALVLIRSRPIRLIRHMRRAGTKPKTAGSTLRLITRIPFVRGGSSSAIRGTGLTPPPILWRRVSLNAMAACTDLSIRVLERVL